MYNFIYIPLIFPRLMDWWSLLTPEEKLYWDNVVFSEAAIGDREDFDKHPEMVDELFQDSQKRLNDVDWQFLEADYWDRINIWGYNQCWVYGRWLAGYSLVE